jgi:hypothetical protein
MKHLTVYSAMPYEETLQVLSREGFKPTKGKPFMWAHPVSNENAVFWDVHEWFCAANEKGFLIFPEAIIEPKIRTSPPLSSYKSQATNFDYREVMRYHELTHELPNSIVTTADENVQKFLDGIPGNENPFLKVVRALINPVVFLGEQAYRGSELGKIVERLSAVRA